MTPTPLRCKMRRGQNGFTLAELLMAMSVCALLATGVLSLLGGTLSAADYQHQMRGHAVRQTVLSERLGTVFRATAQVLFLDTETAVFWVGDRDMDGEVDISEVCVLVWDPVAGTLSKYDDADAIADSAEVGYAPATDFPALLTPLLGSSDLPGGVVARNLSAFSIETSGGTSVMPELIHLSMQFDGMAETQGIEIAVAPRVSELP